MDFDHREGEKKAAPIPILLRDGATAKLEKELRKCDVVCANCHRARTYERSHNLKAGSIGRGSNPLAGTMPD